MKINNDNDDKMKKFMEITTLIFIAMVRLFLCF